MNPPIRNKVLRTCISFLFVVYILTLIKFIILKHPGELKTHFIDNYSWELVRKNISVGNYIPFYTVKYYLHGIDPTQYSRENLFGNILLFLPLGTFLPLLFRNLSDLKNVAIAGLLLSVTFESIQLFTVLGTFDVDDIILNLIGCVIGFQVYQLTRNLSAGK
jgi:glycopeptide antibiotics resistance protein